MRNVDLGGVLPVVQGNGCGSLGYSGFPNFQTAGRAAAGLAKGKSDRSVVRARLIPVMNCLMYLHTSIYICTYIGT